jgi:hypothetical protein
MEKEKVLGKITYAEFGQYNDRPFLFGLQLIFEGSFGGIGCGGRYLVNISPECKWDPLERLQAIENMVVSLDKILSDAKVNNVSQLEGKPVEVTIENRTFKDFRILTEVI